MLLCVGKHAAQWYSKEDKYVYMYHAAVIRLNNHNHILRPLGAGRKSIVRYGPIVRLPRWLLSERLNVVPDFEFSMSVWGQTPMEPMKLLSESHNRKT